MNTGFADIIIGTQYGDEGKARVVDDKAPNYDIIARFNGGANAGHTIVFQGKKVALKQVPSAVFYPDKQMYVGSGCVINVAKLHDEIQSLKEADIELTGRFRLSAQAGVVQPHHILIDTMIGGKVGTTKNGIGPAYADRALRMWDDRLLNIRLGDLLEDRDKYLKIMADNATFISQTYGFPFDAAPEIDALRQALDSVAPFIEKDTLFLQRQVQNGGRVLFEGAQAFMLDVNKGSVPFVTSSGTTAAAAYTGGDLSPNFHRKTIGIAKVLMSRVGHGPFTSEFGGTLSEDYCMAQDSAGNSLHSREVEATYNLEERIKSDNPLEVGQALRVLSAEYGTVTGRPRRIGAFDLVQLAYAVKTNGIDSLVLTKCDLVQAYSRTQDGRIPLVVGYELDGERIDFVPASTATYARVKPVYEYLEGFSEDISHCRSASELPASLRQMIERTEQLTGAKVEGLGVGPDREQYVNL